MTSPSELAKTCNERVGKQTWRIQQYEQFWTEYTGSKGGGSSGGVRGSYADGRPALQDLSEFRQKLQARPGAPNWIKPIVDDRVAVTCPLPTMTFDAMSDSDEDQKQAALVSRAVRGQYEISQMAVGQTHAAFFNSLFGEVCYTLDPLRPKDAQKAKDPFALPGVYINVQDPRTAFPRFGTGRDINRIQDLFLVYKDTPRSEVEQLYPNAMGKMGTQDKIDIIVFYTSKQKIVILSQGQNATEAYSEDHDYGFCPAEWAINKTSGTQFGTSEIDQTLDLHRNSQALFHLAMDGAILGTFPPMHVHNPEHVGRVRYGPLAVIETVEDGKVEPLSSQINVQVPSMLLDLSSTNLLKQTGTSPLRQDMAIQHANTSGRAINNAQGPMEARLAMSNILLGSTLEWVNSKVAMILFTDKELKKTEMSVYGVEFKGKRGSVTFKGDDLGGLWRNHVEWSDPLGGNKHETLVMSLQLFKEGLISGRKVLETLGEDDPEMLIKEAHLDQQQKMQLAQAAQQAQAPPGGPDAAQQGVALGAGAMPGGPAVPQGGPGGPPPPGAGEGPVQPGPPPPPAGMPGFSPVASAPGGPPGGATPVPDIWSEVLSVTSGLKLHGEVTQAIGTPRGILVSVTDHKDFAILKTALKPVAEMLMGPGAKVDVELAGQGKKGK